MSDFKVEVFVNYREGGFRGVMFEWDPETEEWSDDYIVFHVRNPHTWEERTYVQDEAAAQCLSKIRAAVANEMEWRKLSPHMQDRIIGEGLVFSELVLNRA